MDPTAVVAVSELVKLGLITYLSYARQAGLTEQQIDAAYQEAKKGMLIRDPAKIPD